MSISESHCVIRSVIARAMTVIELTYNLFWNLMRFSTLDDDGPQLRAKVATLETMMELFKDTMLVLEQRLEDKFDECICEAQSMRSSIVSEVQALKLKVGHLSEVAFGEDQEFQFDGNHSTKKSKSCAVVVPGDTDPRSFVDDGDAKQSGPAANLVDGLNGYLGHRGTLVLGGVWNPCGRERCWFTGVDSWHSDAGAGE